MNNKLELTHSDDPYKLNVLSFENHMLHALLLCFDNASLSEIIRQ